MTETSEMGQPACLSIIVSKGSLDAVYPAFILATTAAAMDKSVELFFTFYGLGCLLKDTKPLKVSPLGNPAMKIQMPVGPLWLRKIDFNRILPAFVWTLPGMAAFTTWGFKKQMQLQNQLDFESLRTLCQEMGVKMTACQMTVDLLGYHSNDFIDGTEFAGAATYFANTPENQTLYI